MTCHKCLKLSTLISVLSDVKSEHGDMSVLIRYPDYDELYEYIHTSLENSGTDNNPQYIFVIS